MVQHADVKPPSASTSRRPTWTTCSERLADTRWPSELEGVGWSRGVPVDYLTGAGGVLAGRVRLARAGGPAQRVPPVHHRDRRPDHPLPARASLRSRMPLPLLLIHGWPGSFVEFVDLIGPLTDPAAHGGDPADAFHVVHPVAPRVWVLRSRSPSRLDRWPHRRGVRRADGAARLRPVRRAGRRHRRVRGAARGPARCRARHRRARQRAGRPSRPATRPSWKG